MSKITWHGHAAFMIEEAGLKILIDPFLDGNPSCKIASRDIGSVDLVLITHDHADHVGQAIDICRKHNAMLGAVVGTAEKLVQEGLPSQCVLNTIGFNIGGTVRYKDIAITMVPALHTSESGVPVGYIISLPSGLTIYHAGDTGIFSDMQLWGSLYDIDVSLLPTGGVFTMDARQAAMACQMLNTKNVIPMHWGTFPLLEQGAQDFKAVLKHYAPNCICVDIAPNESIEF